MKVIKYKICTSVPKKTEKGTVREEVLIPVEIRCSAVDLEANLVIARAESYNGVEPEVTDDGTEEAARPTQLDIIEAQVTYTAMMTDTLLEV